MPDPPVSKEVVAAIECVLRERLGKLGFREAKVRAGRDHDGDPVLYIDAFYDLLDEPIETGETFGIIGLVRKAIEPLGEWRFPHIRHRFHERQKVVERP